MHIDTSLVRRLIAEQFPRWAGLAIEPVGSSGTDHSLHRLGADMCVRMPRVDWAIGQVEKEWRWLPVIGPQLPLPVPEPLAKGAPAHGYPSSWSVYRWLEGQAATPERIVDMREAARQLADFLRALHAIDVSEGPAPGAHNFRRGVPLVARDAQVREAIESLRGRYDGDLLTAAWETALAAPVWDRAPLWIHGDLHGDNMLARDGRLSAIIDFGGLGVGDPACDVMVAWSFLRGDARAVFREALAVDEATWTRGRGWALGMALVALPYYEGKNPSIVTRSKRTIAEVLA